MKILGSILICLVLPFAFRPWGFLCPLVFLGYLFFKHRRGIILEIPIFESRVSAPRDVLFKLPDTEDYEAFFKQDRKGLAIVSSDLPVVGMANYRDNAKRFILGTRQRLEIEREPGNPHDNNALKVIGCWFENEMTTGVLGYVPKDEARKIANAYPNAEIHGLINKIFLPIDGLSAGLRISLAVDKALVIIPVNASEFEMARSHAS